MGVCVPVVVACAPRLHTPPPRNTQTHSSALAADCSSRCPARCRTRQPRSPLNPVQKATKRRIFVKSVVHLSHSCFAMPPFRDPGAMTTDELRAELSYSSRPPRFCDFNAAWRALGPAFIRDAGMFTNLTHPQTGSRNN